MKAQLIRETAKHKGALNGPGDKKKIKKKSSSIIKMQLMPATALPTFENFEKQQPKWQ